ncbi:probable tartrate dehydrogenase/decarboxylase [Pantoea ananatis AJ13355]|uniref:Probable tartrate dehydrogenase/decarboxylase n=1 Tax=Pantoea ananatis (strain AJ13355) TaxID=932677 RepID=A0A0H3L2U7_PANAA|nr:probable tartrate dehydrogenase/decarboxylase [Pantoea ananatis AJ13355]
MFTGGQGTLNGVQHGITGFLVAEMLQHHGTTPNLADRVGDIFTGDIGRRAVHRFKQAGEFAFRIDIGRRRDANGAGAGRAEIRQDIAKQIAGNHHIKPVGMQHKIGGKNINMIFIHLDLGIVLTHRLNAVIPVGHGNRDTVRFSGRGQVFFGPTLGQFEGKLQNAIDAHAGHDRFLNDHLPLGAGEHGAAHAGILAFGVFPHHVEIDIARLTVG